MGKKEIVTEIKIILESLTVPDRANPARDIVAAAMRTNGWICATEVLVKDRGDGRRGKVDIAAHKDGWDVGIEIDRRNAREKSAIKLRCREWIRVIATRGVPEPRRFNGIDLYVGLAIQ